MGRGGGRSAGPEGAARPRGYGAERAVGRLCVAVPGCPGAAGEAPGRRRRAAAAPARGETARHKEQRAPGSAPAAPRRAAPRTPCPRLSPVCVRRCVSLRFASAVQIMPETRPGELPALQECRKRGGGSPPHLPFPSPFPRARTKHKAFPAFPGSISFLAGPPSRHLPSPRPLGHRSVGGDPHFAANKTGAAAATGCAQPSSLLAVLVGSGLGELRVGKPLPA